MPEKDISKWFNIWNSKNIKDYSKISLDQLIKVNGFDTGVGSYTKTEWLIMVEHFIQLTELKNEQYIYDIGCGSGAFLYAIKNYVNPYFYGIDYSESLIEIAKNCIDGNFVVSNADKLPTFGRKFDLVFSHSVFQYFPSVEFAFDVLRKTYNLLEKNGKLCLMDINDEEYEYESKKMRIRSFPNEITYNEFYKGCDHLYFSKSKIKNFLLSIGFKDIKIFKHAVEGDLVRKYRFNLIANK